MPFLAVDKTGEEIALRDEVKWRPDSKPNVIKHGTVHKITFTPHYTTVTVWVFGAGHKCVAFRSKFSRFGFERVEE